MIWDFRGPASLHTAQHHIIHLKEYCSMENIPYEKIDLEMFNEMHNTAFIIVTQEYMSKLRTDLQPHKGEYYNP